MKKKKKLRKGVFFVVYAFERGKPIYVLLKRKLHWIGWEFPKAGVEKFETKRAAVKRETVEETDLKPLKIKKFNFSGTFFFKKEFEDLRGVIGQTFSLFSVEVKKGKIKIDPHEHSAYKWLLYKDALKTLTHKNQKESLKMVNDWLVSKLK